jgi:hypothetical protein
MLHVFGVAYFNCGDWVESCTALGENPDGRMEIIRWAEQDRQSLSFVPRAATEAA